MQDETQDNFPGNQNDNSQTDTVSESFSAQSSHYGDTLLEWTASEYIKHHKPFTWYLALVAVVAIITALVFWVTGDMVSTIIIGLVGILFGIFASREPEVRTYKLTPKGIVISEKLYPFGLFKSFAVYEEEAIRSIFLLPMKRFMPGITLYFPPEQEEEILNMLSDYLPFDDSEPDLVDKLMNKIRF